MKRANSKPQAIVFIGNRRFPGSTELCVALEIDKSEFCVALSDMDSFGKGKSLGYLRFIQYGTEVILGKTVGRFVLTEVLPAGSQVPCPVISLSGVLWSRLAAIEAHRSISSFLSEECPKKQFDSPSEQGGFPHGI